MKDLDTTWGFRRYYVWKRNLGDSWGATLGSWVFYVWRKK